MDRRLLVLGHDHCDRYDFRCCGRRCSHYDLRHCGHYSDLTDELASDLVLLRYRLQTYWFGGCFDDSRMCRLRSDARRCVPELPEEGQKGRDQALRNSGCESKGRCGVEFPVELMLICTFRSLTYDGIV